MSKILYQFNAWMLECGGVMPRLNYHQSPECQFTSSFKGDVIFQWGSTSRIRVTSWFDRYCVCAKSKLSWTNSYQNIWLGITKHGKIIILFYSISIFSISSLESSIKRTSNKFYDNFSALVWSNQRSKPHCWHAVTLSDFFYPNSKYMYFTKF